MREALEKIKQAEEKNHQALFALQEKLKAAELEKKQLLQEKRTALQKELAHQLELRETALQQELVDETAVLQKEAEAAQKHYQENFQSLKAEAVKTILERVQTKYGSQ